MIKSLHLAESKEKNFNMIKNYLAKSPFCLSMVGMRNKQPDINPELLEQILSFVFLYVSIRLSAIEKDPSISSKKVKVQMRKAAILMSLYPGVLPRISDIAFWAEVKKDTLAHWVISDTFDNLYGEECEELGRFIANIIVKLIEKNREVQDLCRKYFKLGDDPENLLIDIAAHLCGLVHEPIYALQGKINEWHFYGTISRLHADLRGPGERGREIAKEIIREGFRMLMHPDEYPDLTVDGREKVADDLKGWVFQLIDERR